MQESIYYTLILLKIKASINNNNKSISTRTFACTRFGDFSSNQHQHRKMFMCELLPRLKCPFIYKQLFLLVQLETQLFYQ